jgi:hypothetical protein
MSHAILLEVVTPALAAIVTQQSIVIWMPTPALFIALPERPAVDLATVVMEALTPGFIAQNLLMLH